MESRITGIEHDAQEIKEAVKRMAATNHSGNQNVTTVRFEAGAIGIWLCATACLCTLVAVVVGSVIGGMWLSREAQRVEARAAEQEVKIDRANVLLSATWQHIPDVAEKVKRENPEKKNAER
jgi:hypothetical protein